MSELEKLVKQAHARGWHDGERAGAKGVEELAAQLRRYREALEAIQHEAGRENGKWQHLKRCIAVQARNALQEQTP